MNDQDKSREQLIAELEELRQRPAAERSTPEMKTAAALFRVAPLGIHACDTEGRIIFVNPSQEAITGYTAEELIGTWIWDRLPPGPEKDSLPAYFKHLISVQPAPVPFFAKNIRKSGEVFDARIDWNYIRNPEGEVTGFVSIVSDITEGKQTETALRESERRLATLMSNLPGMAYRCRNDPQWSMEFVSDGCSQLTGYSASELLENRGVAYGDIIHPDDRQAVSDQVQQALAERRRFQLEYRIRTAQGEERWVWEQGVGVFSGAGEVHALEGFITDITDRKRAGTALRESERRLKTLISNLPGAVYRCKADPDWTVEFLSGGYLSLTGDEPSQLIGRPSTRYTELIHADDRQRAFDVMQKALAQGRHYQMEYRLRTATGQEKWIWEQGIGVFSESGELKTLEGFTTDITARKRAEEELQQANERLEQSVRERTAKLTRANERLQAEVAQRQQAEDALRQNEAKYRALVESSPDAVVMVDLQGRIVFASQRAAEQHGVLDPAELVGRQATDFVIESERDRFRASIGRLIEEGVHRNVEYTLLRKDGTTFDAEVSSAVISDAAGKPEAFMAVYRDISERKQADEVMRQTLDQLAAIYDGMIEGLLITDIETKRFVRVNAPFCRMLGYSEEELLAKAIKDIHPAEEVPNDERRFQAAAEGRVSFNEERPVLRKDGSIFYADITGHRIFYDERPCLLALFRDVTERRQAEAKLKAEQNALRRMVLASDHERRLITYELHDGVAQQLMGAIMHFQSQEPPPGGTPSANDAYREGMKALRQASSEIRSVMSRLRTPVLDMYGLAEAIEDVAAQLRSIPGAPEIECRYDIQFERLEPTLEISLFRIAQEAVTNACRHSKSEKVRVQLTQKGDWVALEVRDWGIGFDKARIQGNRFGLEGIRQRSRLLGGNLSIKSKPGEGTVVRVKFPVMEATDDE